MYSLVDKFVGVRPGSDLEKFSLGSDCVASAAVTSVRRPPGKSCRLPQFTYPSDGPARVARFLRQTKKIVRITPNKRRTTHPKTVTPLKPNGPIATR